MASLSGPTVVCLCEELHSRVRRSRDVVTLDEDLQRRFRAFLPYAHRRTIDALRVGVRLQPLDWTGAYPGRSCQGSSASLLVAPPCDTGDIVVHGLLMLDRPASVFDGPLSLKAIFHCISHEVSGRNERNTFFQVLRTLAFDEPLRWVESAVVDMRRHHQVVRISRTSSLRLRDTAGVPFERQVAGREEEMGCPTPRLPIAVQQWLSDHDVDVPTQFIGVFADPCLRDLLVRGCWGILAIYAPKPKARFEALRHLLEGTCLAHMDAAQMEKSSPAVDDDLVGPPGIPEFQLQAVKVASFLRNLAPQVLAADPHARGCLEEAVAFTDSLVTRLTPAGLSANKGKHMFSTVFLLRCLVLAQMLRSSDRLRDAIATSISLVLPPELAECVLQSFHDKTMKLPSPSSLSRFYFVADAALMMLQRKAHADEQNIAERDNQAPARYVMVDSSSQVGADWMVTVVTEIAADQLVPVCTAVERIAALRDTNKEARAATSGGDHEPDEADVLQEIQDMEETIARAVCMHTLPPVAIGYGSSSLSHKASALCHQMRLERSSWSEVRWMAHTVCAFTTDLGTEHNLYKVPARVDLSELVPGFEDMFNTEPTEPDPEPDGPVTASPAVEIESSVEAEAVEAPDDQGQEVVQAVQSLEGFAVGDPEMSIDADAADDLEVAPAASGHLDQALFDQAVPIPGFMHVLHNSVRDVTNSLAAFDWFQGPLRALCHYMSKKPNRERLVGLCFANPPSSWCASDIMGFAPQLVDTRWGYLVNTLQDLGSIETALRSYWDSTKMDAGQGMQDYDGDHKPADFITSAAHWSYSQMLLLVHEVIEELEVWMWQCPCHADEDLGVANGSWSKRSRAFRRHSPLSTFSTCPMRGRRAADVAAGEVENIMEKHAGRNIQEVLALTQGLKPADRDKILHDYGRAHKHMKYVITLKLNVFQHLPHKLMGIAHHDEAVAHACCLVCADLARVLSSDDRASQHAWVREVITGPGELHDQFRMFCFEGVALSELPQLAHFRARLRFVPIVETLIESRHKDIKVEGKQKTCNIQSSRVSMKLRAAELERAIHTDKHFLASFALECSPLRRMSALLHSLHLARHPAILDYLQQAGDPEFNVVFASHSNHALAESIVYRRDPQSQFQNMSKFKMDDDGRAKPNTRKRHRVGGAPGPSPGEHAAVLHAAAVAHFRQKSSAAAFYSQAPSAPSRLIPMDEALHAGTRLLHDARQAALVAVAGAVPGGVTSGCSAEWTLEKSALDLYDDSAPAPAALAVRKRPVESHHFFRLVHRSPASQVLASREAATSADQFAVCCHSVLGACKTTNSVTLNLNHEDKAAGDGVASALQPPADDGGVFSGRSLGAPLCRTCRFASRSGS